MPGILPNGSGLSKPGVLNSYDLSKPQGLVTPGNIDPWHRKVLNNEDGSVSTTRSFSIGTDKGETLIPQVVDGKMLSKRDAIAHYMRTGQHLGIFQSPEAADAYASALHNVQAQAVENPSMHAFPALQSAGAFQQEQPYTPPVKLPAGPIPKEMLDKMRQDLASRQRQP